ncbi:MAG TPA: hypothetical protein VIF44_06650 [Candidatus Limnocylindrales bacterium]|jgi:hypothetical protein
MATFDTAAGTVHLRLSRRARIELESARQRLGAATWLGFEIGTVDRPLRGTPTKDATETRRYETDLGLPLRPGSQRTIFRKAALVELGVPETNATGLRVPIAWRSATMAPLFPVFAGALEVLPDELVLDGWYAPPGGSAGLVVDRALLNLAARGTARWFLDRIAEAIETPAGRQPRQGAR